MLPVMAKHGDTTAWVYVWTRRDTGQVYVGTTIDLAQRERGHISDALSGKRSCPIFHAALAKDLRSGGSIHDHYHCRVARYDSPVQARLAEVCEVARAGGPRSGLCMNAIWPTLDGGIRMSAAERMRAVEEAMTAHELFIKRMRAEAHARRRALTINERLDVCDAVAAGTWRRHPLNRSYLSPATGEGN